MKECKLDITERAGKDGKVWKNIDLRKMENDSYIVVTKTSFAEGREVKAMSKDGKAFTFYSCGVTYNGELVSMSLVPKDHAVYAKVGGVGDQVKICLAKTIESKTGKDKITRDVVVRKYTFEVV